MKLRFVWVQSISENGDIEEIIRKMSMFDKERERVINLFPGESGSSHTGVLDLVRRHVIEYPSFILREEEGIITNRLATKCKEMLSRLLERLDEAEYYADNLEGIERAKELGRLGRLREELILWKKTIDEESFEILELVPILGREFPNIHQLTPFYSFSMEEKNEIADKVKSIVEQYKAKFQMPFYEIDNTLMKRLIRDCEDFARDFKRQSKFLRNPGDIVNSQIAELDKAISSHEKRFLEDEKQPKEQEYRDLNTGEIRTQSIPNYSEGLLAHVKFFNTVKIEFLRSIIPNAEQSEPEEFRQIWLNPKEDIPFVLKAFKDLEFIDENDNWRTNKYPNPLGPIKALIDYPKHSFFQSIARIQIERAFCHRFNIQQPKKGFKPENRPFESSKKMMHRYLCDNV